MNPRIHQLVEELNQLSEARRSRLLDAFFLQIAAPEPPPAFESLDELRTSALQEIQAGEVMTWDEFFERAESIRNDSE